MKRLNIGLGVIVGLLIVGAVFYCFRQVSSPEQVFRRMLETNLSAYSSTRVVAQDADSQISQANQTQTGVNNVVSGVTTISQQSSDTVIKTESLGTPTSDFIRYSSIETSQVGESGNPLDFSSVIGLWGETTNGASSLRAGELFGEATLGIVPFGRIDIAQRNELVEMILSENVYGIDYDAVQKKTIDGRKVYVYEAKIEADKYVSMLQKFGEYIKSEQLKDVDPSQFSGRPAIEVSMIIDKLSGQLLGVEFPETERTEIYKSYGAINNVSLPSHTIPVSELQQKLQNIR